MRDVFTMTEYEHVEEYTRRKMEQYHTDEKEFTDLFSTVKFFSILLWYLISYRNEQEKCIYSAINLLHLSLGRKNFRFSACHRLLSECIEEHQDVHLQELEKIIDGINTNTIEEILDFLEYDICKRKIILTDPEGVLSLGNIEIIKMKMSTRTRKSLGKDYKIFLGKITPLLLKEYLDDRVIGQEETKKVISLAVYSHYKRICYPKQKLIKTNVLMVGPTGCGKTEIMRSLAAILNVPVIITDVSGVVATPYKGRNKEDILLELYLKANSNLSDAEKGIIFLDEFDKIIKPMHSSSENINDELQSQLLGIFEGTDVELCVNDKKVTLNTSNILFICAGAFDGLKGAADQKTERAPIGFKIGENPNEMVETISDYDCVDDLIQYGMKPELAGRLGEITFLKNLTKEEILKIMTELKDSFINKYKREFMDFDHVELEFETEVLEEIAEKVSAMKIGARGISSFINNLLQDALFEVPGSSIRKIIVTKDSQTGKLLVKHLADDIIQ